MILLIVIAPPPGLCGHPLHGGFLREQSSFLRVRHCRGVDVCARRRSQLIAGGFELFRVFPVKTERTSCQHVQNILRKHR